MQWVASRSIPCCTYTAVSYLLCRVLDEYLTLNAGAAELAPSISRTLCVLISKYISTGGMDYTVCRTLYEAYFEL